MGKEEEDEEERFFHGGIVAWRGGVRLVENGERKSEGVKERPEVVPSVVVRIVGSHGPSAAWPGAQKSRAGKCRATSVGMTVVLAWEARRTRAERSSPQS